jgi:hypothetical protein
MFNKSTIIITILISLAAIIAPLYYDDIKSYKELTLELMSDVTLISQSNKIDGLKVTFNDVSIEELSQLTYRFSNTGNTEIASKTIQIPLTLNLNKSNLVTYRTENANPSYIIDDININHNVSKNQIIIKFKNNIKPNESITFSVFLDGELTNPLNSYIRVEGIDKLNKINHVKQIEEERENKNHWLLDVLKVVLLLLFIMTLALIIMFIMDIKAIKQLKNYLDSNDININSLKLSEIPDFMNKHMTWLGNTKTDGILSIIKEETLSEEEKHTKIIEKLKSEMNYKDMQNGMIFLSLVFLFLGYYLFIS